jgi:hypothetical protein
MAKHDPDDPFADIPHDDDPFADIPLDVTGHHANADGTYSPTKPKPARSVVDPDMPHTTAEHWNGTSGFPGMKQRAQHASNASYQRSVSEDEANRPVSDDVAAGILAAGNAADTLGVADEFRGLYGGAGAALGTLAGGGGLDDVKRNAREAYEHGRDQQREATAQAEENSPMASAAGQQVGIWGPGIASIWAKAPQLAAQVVKNSGPLSALLKSALAGSAMGGASGLGHGEGDVDEQLKQAGGGALVGAGLGAAGAALPAATMKLAPKASLMPVGAGLRAAPREAAGNVATAAGKAGRSTLAAALDALATGVGKAPLAGGAAVGGHLGGPVGAGVGGLVGQKVLGAQADALAGKLSGKADAVRAKNAPPTKLRGLLDDAFTAPQLTSPSGLALDTTTPKVNAEMARLKRAIRDEQSVPVADEDVVSAESATNPWAQAMANAREGGALSDLLRPVTGGPTSPSSAPSPRTPPPMPPQSGVMRLLVDTGLLSPPAPKSGATWSLSSQALRSNELPAPVRARLQKLADDAAQAEPSTTQDTSGAAGFDDGVSAPVDEYGVPLDQFPLEESVAAKPSALAKQRAEQPPPPRASPPSTTSSSLPNTAVMTNPTMGRLRIAASRENAAASPWSDALDVAEAPAFDEHGNELRNPRIKESWREAAARHTLPQEGGPTSTADMLDEDVGALLERGGRTKGALQPQGSAYFPKRNALLGQQAKDPALDDSVRESALALLDTSRTAKRPGGEFDEPLPSFVTKTADEMGFSGKDEPRSSTWQRREGGSDVMSAGAEQRAVKLANRHAREDALPTDRGALLQQLLAEAGADSPSPKADAAWRSFKASGRKGARPPALGGGTLDAFQAAKEGKAPSSLLEAWENELRGIKTWRELRESGALDALAQALGVDEVRLPDDVVQRHLTQDLERE